MTPDFDVVVPTAGRPSLGVLLERLLALEGSVPGQILIVDDSGHVDPASLPDTVRLVSGPGRGPAAARNAGWHASQAEWIAFLDDDVVPEPDWGAALAADLDVEPHVGGSQGRIRVPVSPAPTDWERNVQGLESARYATADMAYRRAALEEVGGFDERFQRAFREDADLALRVLNAGYRIQRGTRRVLHPVRPTGFWISVSLQAGNADDVLMRSLHGPYWRERAAAPKGRRATHLAVTGAGVAALTAATFGKRRAATAAALAWAAGTAELAWRRIAPGPRTREEITRMLVTSAAIPAAATAYWLAGWARLGWRRAADPRPAAVLFDRDGTLVENVPYNGDPEQVVAVRGAREALDRVRSAGLPVGVISNQSGIGRGLITREQVEAVNRRVEQLLGPVDKWLYCPHEPDDGCECRKPAPGLVERMATALGVDPSRCVVVGDIGADVEAARAAGARSVLVPTPETLPEEVEAAPVVARNLSEAVEIALGGAR